MNLLAPCRVLKSLVNMKKNLLAYHPCFHENAHFSYGRVHLPVAPQCNLQCRYCARGISNDETDIRPGLTSLIMTPPEALEHVRVVTVNKPSIKVVGIAGPGEPLANPQTFETLKIVHRNFPELLLCLSTNGLLLQDRHALLLRHHVATVTITINAVDTRIASKIYAGLHFRGARMYGEKAARLLIQQQLSGLRQAVRTGIHVKINSIYFPRINSDHLETVAMTVAEAGAELMNIVPLIPAGAFRHFSRTDHETLYHIRQRCARYIKQFHLCRQCRADAVGIPGFERNSTSN